MEEAVRLHKTPRDHGRGSEVALNPSWSWQRQWGCIKPLVIMAEVVRLLWAPNA